MGRNLRPPPRLPKLPERGERGQSGDEALQKLSNRKCDVPRVGEHMEVVGGEGLTGPVRFRSAPHLAMCVYSIWLFLTPLL